jgi:hypothetical protein
MDRLLAFLNWRLLRLFTAHKTHAMIKNAAKPKKMIDAV